MALVVKRQRQLLAQTEGPGLGGGGENDELVAISVHSLNKFMHSWPRHSTGCLGLV